MRNAHKSSVGEYEGRNHLEDLCVYGTITLKWILNKSVRLWNGFIWFWIGSSRRIL
jgi:hypothetical protein